MGRTAAIELEAGHGRDEVRMAVHPDAGGRVGSLEIGATRVLRDDPSVGALMWGIYPMVPWAGRVRHGEFMFDGIARQLPVNLPPHAIHGTVFEAEWEVVDAGSDYCELRCPLEWEFGGVAHQHVHLHPDGATLVLTAAATGEAMPAVVGWHPCFVKPLAADLRFARMHVRDQDGVALADLVPPAEHPWDDCFVEPLAPLRLHYDALALTIGSDCANWVVYDEPADTTCVEPQSGPPDAFNIGGATRLEPGAILQRTMTLTWARPTK
ncbi:MAG: hypothetical protein R2694_09835 [Ilumatobacteraceae bacterium]